MIWQTLDACEPEGVLSPFKPVKCISSSALPTSLVLMGRAVGSLSPAGPEGLEKNEKGCLSRCISSADRCFSSLLAFLAALCCLFLPRNPRHYQVSSVCARWIDKVPGRLSVFCFWVSGWAISGETMSLGQTRWTMHKIMFEKKYAHPINKHFGRFSVWFAPSFW